MALKYYDDSFECLSSWKKDELKSFSSFLKKLAETGWENAHRSGLRMKPIDLKTVRTGGECLKRVRNSVSPDIDFVEFRVNDKVRVHGFRLLDTFFLILLDREHRLYPE